MASSTVALATEATLFSVAGSMTSKRAPSEDFRHLPPIHRSVGTLARRLSYIAMVTPRFFASWPDLVGHPDRFGTMRAKRSGHRDEPGDDTPSTFHCAFYSLDDSLD